MALDFFAGCVGGAAGVIVGHPLDTVKVRLQTQSPTNIKYRGTFHCLSTIVKQESVAGLYKGISSPLFGVAGVNALIFGVYGALRPYVSGAPGNDALWAHFAAGSISGAVQSVIASPMELVKTRLQISEDLPGGKKLGPVEVLKGIYKNEGGLFRGVFKGWGITLGREIPGFGFYFASYEALTRIGDGQVGTLGMMLAGGMAGVVSWIVTFPIDVVKTRLQCDSCGKYKGIFDCVRKTYVAEGYRAFTRGLVSTVIRAFPTNAATFTVVTWIMRLGETVPDDDADSNKYMMEELLAKRSQFQEQMEDSLRLKVPQYLFCGNSLTSCSLSSQCSTSAQKYASRTQTYFNFYQSLQDQIREEDQFNYVENNTKNKLASEVRTDEIINLGLNQQDKSSLHDKLVVPENHHNTTSRPQPNPQGRENLIFVSSSSSGSISTNIPQVLEEEEEDNESDYNRNVDDSVQQNNEIPSESSLLLRKSRIENRSERENNVNPVNTTSSPSTDVNCTEETSKKTNGCTKNSSLIHGNGGFSHEATSFPSAASDTAGVVVQEEPDVAQILPTNSNDNDNLLSSRDLNYLSKSLDLPAHILAAAVAQQNYKSKAIKYNVENDANLEKGDKIKAQKKSISSSQSRKESGNVAQALRNYCSNYNTPAAAMKLCRCFEDHCVCYL